jgi:S-adenosylmethionine/arginine decarboxylase-like enzyme
MNQVPYGAHLMGDLNGCVSGRMRDGEYLYRFLKNLVEEIEMEAMGSPHLDLYTGPHIEWDGFSGTIHIQSSHITCHVFAFGYVFIDIFSCKPINIRKAKDFIVKAWEPAHVMWQSVNRGFNFPVHLIDPSQSRIAR